MKFALLFILIAPVLAQAKCIDNKLYQKLSNLNCSPKKIHLTFDDGPRGATTPVIMDELNKRKIKASFFVSTTNLENSQENRKIVNDLMKSGHYIASHGHDHHCYDHRYGADKKAIEVPFTEKERGIQIAKSDKLLNLATDGKFSKQKQGKFFRFPYGRGAMPSPYEIELMIQKGMKIEGSTYAEKLSYYRTHSPAISTISEFEYSHMGWNFDSQDSSLGAEIADEKTVEKYLTENLTRMCQSREKVLITLFHDIKKLNSKSIGTLIDTAQCMGLNFVDIDEALTLRDQLVKSGVIVNKYELNTDSIKELLDQVVTVNDKISQRCEPKISGEKKSCHSEYTSKEVPHCHGADSICVDGKFYAKGSLVPHTECGHDLIENNSKLSINQTKCSTPSEAKVIIPESIKCYCQENDKQELKWNCYDITEVPARKL